MSEIEVKVNEIERRLEGLNLRSDELKKLTTANESDKLTQENARLKDEIEILKKSLREANDTQEPAFIVEVSKEDLKAEAEAREKQSQKVDTSQQPQMSKKKQYQLKAKLEAAKKEADTKTETDAAAASSSNDKNQNKEQNSNNQQKNNPTNNQKKKQKQPKQKKPQVAPVELPVDISRLNLKVGVIVNCERHPDADSLYVEQIDLGEGEPRTIVSGLVRHVPIEEMQNRPVMVLSNLKPAKMRGIVSNGMVMCATSAEGKVVIVAPPAGAVPGDRVLCEGYIEGKPDDVLNPKKKIFEQVAPDLVTNEECVACYKGIPLTVEGKGPLTAPTVVKGLIK